MSQTYPRYVRDVILARVAAGETVKAICAEPGMPCARSLVEWRRRDPIFRAALEDAVAKGRWRRFRQFDAAKAGALIERLAAGELLSHALAQPDTPSQLAFRYWRATDHGFAEDLARIMGVKREETIARNKRRWRAFDRALADQILLRVGRGTPLRRVLSADKALPCLTVLERWRRERPEFDGELKVAMKASRYVARARRLWSEELQDEIIERIARGASFRQLALDPDMPCEKTLHNWVKKKPEFRDAVRWACREREIGHNEQMLTLAEGTAAGMGGLGIKGLSVGGARRRINRLRRQNGWRSRWPGGSPDADEA